ncbi:hypothetical protein QQ045_009602 [Rhodiola kirilowii]
MTSTFFHICILGFFLISAPSGIYAQQPYAKKSTTNCTTVADNSASLLGYSCNGIAENCEAYVVFRSLPPHNSVSSISALLSADPSQVSRINNVSDDTVFESNHLVIVPIRCSCSGPYYQKNTTYVVRQENTPFVIANNTFQGLSTCHAVKAENSDLSAQIYSGERFNIPLRCACPTRNQTDSGIKYLLSYIITWGDTISNINLRFGADLDSTFQANSLTMQDFNIYPFTTFLVPLKNQPSAIASTNPPASPPPPHQTASPLPTTKHQKHRKSAVIGAVAGIGLASLVGVVALWVFLRKTRKHSEAVTDAESFEANEKRSNKKAEDESHSHSNEFLQTLSSISQSMKMYSYEELQSATDEFSPSCLIRGSVYRGEINGNLAAIKRIDGDVSKEINILNRINHFNLIHLSGFCFNEGHWYLVYEYAMNGPLSDWIYINNAGQKFLNWTQRIQIAMDVATGLSYLHSYTTPPHVHQDIKTSNVLLDSNFRGKITNFNLARSTEGEEGQLVLTRHIVGTKGYMAPEYVEHGLVSTKLDVYAFGIFMLECITGKKVSEFYKEENVDLSEMISSMLHKERSNQDLKDFIDPALKENYPYELALFMFRLIELCIKKTPAARPDMNEVVPNLSRILNASFTREISSNMQDY